MAIYQSTSRNTALAQRRALEAELYLKGYSMSDISERVGVTTATVSRDIKAIRQAWVEAQIEYIGESVSRELDRLDMIESEAWQAYERSQSPIVTTVEREGKRYGLINLEGGRTLSGSAKWLEIALRCHERRCRILSLDSPEVIEIIARMQGGESVDHRKGYITISPDDWDTVDAEDIAIELLQAGDTADELDESDDETEADDGSQIDD